MDAALQCIDCGHESRYHKWKGLHSKPLQDIVCNVDGCTCRRYSRKGSRVIRLSPETYKRLQDLAVVYNMQFKPADKVVAAALDDLDRLMKEAGDK